MSPKEYKWFITMNLPCKIASQVILIYVSVTTSITRFTVGSLDFL